MRIVTALWVSVSNLFFASLVFRALLAQRTFYGLLETPLSWKYYLVPGSIIAILVVGVLLELANSPAAVFVNAGFFLLVSGFATVGVAYGWPDTGSRTFGLPLHILLLLVLATDVLLYAGKKRFRRAERPA
ncbi:MAG TPA: hypothetical protein VMD77_07325 [Candidatus Baltobacteraceae bacterium]|nr:hypothetical protein [Candidatus Baltobacteraceae bacterium]